MDFIENKRLFDEWRGQLQLPDGCNEPHPATYFPFATNIHAWRFHWVIEFPDGKYLRVKEHWQKVKGLQESQRRGFALHYGPIASRSVDGFPEFGAKDPVDIRIDNSGSPAHLHYEAADPHYTQQQVKDLTLNDVKVISFVEAVLRHRKTGRPLKKVFGFKI